MSPASSGGVSSSVAWTAARISESGLSSGAADLRAVELELAREAGHEVAAADRGGQLGLERRRGADGELDASALCEPIAVTSAPRM